MRRLHSWLAALGIAAATPGLTYAGPMSLFSNGDSRPAASSNAKATNQKVANDIAKALRSARLAGYDIEVEYKNGVATLIGQVPTAQQRAIANKVTQEVEGVRKVDNQLTVKDAAKPRQEMAAEASNRRPTQPRQRAPIQQVQYEDDSRSSGEVDRNQMMADRIADALRKSRFQGESVEIQFQDGVAVISGSVRDAQAKNSATLIASRVPGVKRVDNQLEAQAPTRRRGGPIQRVQYDEASNEMGPGGTLGPMGPNSPMGPVQGPYPPGGPGGYPGGAMPAGMMQGPGGPMPMQGAMPMSGSNPVMYDQPNLPEHAWPAYASYPNYAAVTYPKQYSASAWPYIGPFYPYPQVPLGWRKVQLEWDDGYWQLNFRSRTDRWWWFMDYRNW